MLSSVMEKGTVLRFWLDALVPKGQINKKPVESCKPPDLFFGKSVHFPPQITEVFCNSK